jgi:hypothetical protein
MATSKREKIILGLAILAVLYMGGRYLFSSSGTDRTGLETEEDSAYGLVMEVAERIAQYNLTDMEQRVLEKAQMPWPDQPFITQQASAGTAEPSESSILPATESDNYRFTGYLEIGNKRLAIINGEEYETGDRLTESNAAVRSISPELVLLTDAEGRMLSVPRADLTH